MENKTEWVFYASSVLKEIGVWLGESLVKRHLFFPVRLGLSHCSSLLLKKKKKTGFFFNDHVSVDLGPQRGCYTDYQSTSRA